MPWIHESPHRLRSRATGGSRGRARDVHRLRAVAGSSRKCAASGPHPAAATAYSYDSAGHRATQTDARGISVTPIGSGPQTLVSAVSYYPFGPVKKITWGKGETQTRTYDQNYWIDQIDSNLAGAHALDLDFTLDAVGNITALSDVLGGQPPNNSYQYDPLYRLNAVLDVAGANRAGVRSCIDT